jgi:hypothetical protein
VRRELIAVLSENTAKHTNTLRGLEAESGNVAAGGTQ